MKDFKTAIAELPLTFTPKDKSHLHTLCEQFPSSVHAIELTKLTFHKRNFYVVYMSIPLKDETDHDKYLTYLGCSSMVERVIGETEETTEKRVAVDKEFKISWLQRRFIKAIEEGFYMKKKNKPTSEEGLKDGGTGEEIKHLIDLKRISEITIVKVDLANLNSQTNV